MMPKKIVVLAPIFQTSSKNIEYICEKSLKLSCFINVKKNTYSENCSHSVFIIFENKFIGF